MTEEKVKEDCIIATDAIFKKRRIMEPEEISKYAAYFVQELRKRTYCHIEKLNNDILLIILQSCDSWKSISRVCKRWRKLCKELSFDKFRGRKKITPYWLTEVQKDCLYSQWVLRGLCKGITLKWVKDISKKTIIKINISLDSGTILFQTKINNDSENIIKRIIISEISHLSTEFDISSIKIDSVGDIAKIFYALNKFFFDRPYTFCEKRVILDLETNIDEYNRSVKLYKEGKKFEQTLELNKDPYSSTKIYIRRMNGSWDFAGEATYFWKDY